MKEIKGLDELREELDKQGLLKAKGIRILLDPFEILALHVFQFTRNLGGWNKDNSDHEMMVGIAMPKPLREFFDGIEISGGTKGDFETNFFTALCIRGIWGYKEDLKKRAEQCKNEQGEGLTIDEFIQQAKERMEHGEPKGS